jgi:nitrite reductase/ring-hydroxylating ferredoxin subunit
MATDLPDGWLEGLMRYLCRIEEIPEGGSKGFPAPPGRFTGLFAVRQGRDVFVYVNACPHLGTPLDWMPDRFLSTDGARIICATWRRVPNRQWFVFGGTMRGGSAGAGADPGQGRHHIGARRCWALARGTGPSD